MRTLLAPVRWLARFPIFQSLRLRVTLLVLLGALPAIALLFLTAQQQRNDALSEGQDTANRLVREFGEVAEQARIGGEICGPIGAEAEHVPQHLALNQVGFEIIADGDRFAWHAQGPFSRRP